MIRTALTAALVLTPALAAAQPGELDALPAIAPEAVPRGGAPAGELEIPDEVPVEFCGAGESSVVDLAYYEMQDGRLRRARRMLVTALREGAVEAWQRGQALATLAEVQLRLRQYRRAVVNYRKALRVDPDELPVTVRVGLATALHLRGARAAAHEQAAAAREEVCANRWSMVECFAANALLVRTSRDAAEVERATETLSALRAAHGDLAASFDEVEARLERRRSTADRS